MSGESENHLDESLPQVAMLKMITGAWLAQAIYAAASLGVADALIDGPKSAAQLAAELGAEPRALHRLLRLLASHEIFAEQPGGVFANTERSECLQKEAFGSVRSMALLCGEEHYRSWGDILHTIKTGEPAFDRIYQQGFYQYIEQRPRESAIFHDAMSNMAILGNMAVANGYPFPEGATVVDVGGGNGALLAAVLQQLPGAKGVLFDTARGVADAAAFLQTAGVDDRSTCVAGDFFQAVPSGDIYLLSRILQNFDDAACITLLQNCKRAMNPGGKVLIIEMVIPPGNKPFFGKLSDMNMLVMTRGLERTKEEYAALLEAAGLTLSRVMPTESPSTIIEAAS